MASIEEPTENDAMSQIRAGLAEAYPQACILLCGAVPFYTQAHSWSCSYACAMMFFVALALRDGGFRDALAEAGLVSAEGAVCATGIRAIQEAIERAWKAGLNSRGRDKIIGFAPDEPFVGREDESAQMGPLQIAAALRMVGVLTTTRRCNGAEELLDALRVHFTASDDPAPCVYTNGKHVRVAVGVVVVALGDVRLVYLDPIWDEVEVKVLRKHHLRDPAYELLYLGSEYEFRKIPKVGIVAAACRRHQHNICAQPGRPQNRLC